MRVLLIEDDEPLADILKQSLSSQNYLVEMVIDGQAGWNLVEVFEYDIILLDIKLPRLDGISFCQRLRREGSYRSQSLNHNTPILLMTATDASNNRVAGLDAGADDYIVKPFDLDELLARVRALLRRRNGERSPILEWEQLQVNPIKCQVSYQGQPFHLSSKEYKLLELFLRHQERIFSHGTLIEHLWALEDIPTENAIRAQIKGLRKRLKEFGIEDCIETVYGLGYRLKEAQIAKDQKNNKQTEDIQRQSEQSTPNQQIQHHVVSSINQLWGQYRGQYLNRLCVIEQAVSALQTETLTEELQQQAKQEVHTLKGSLGLFGLDGVSELSCEIEELFNVINKLDQKQKAQLAELTFSLRQALEQSSPKTELSNEETNHNIPSQKLLLSQRSRLMIVDDDAQLLDILQVMLQPWGFQITLLSDCQEFWQTLDKVRPDLLMLDIEIPKINGIDLCQRIRNDLHWGDLPILIISADTDDETIQRVFMAGADDYVSKPIRAAELVARVIRRLEHANVLKKLRAFGG
ncbi:MULTISPECIES: response regulator [Nostoc]|uniref:Response regulator n=2 Tax=Nostoc TaxID=1177 RepID=A0ABR8IJF2_9NOSO|nr:MULTISPECIES: response regulator [Nostoc]MBD2564960.1 response regulator [Nostoc linckia FACHB-391]MBD2651087.1 response regulator [Nostoc foliaceum FACHB-393]